MNPRTLFTWLARAEVVTWTLLLIGMALKYVTRTTELGVSVFGLVHGVVFLAFVLVTVVLWVDQRWPLREVVLVLACAIPRSRRCTPSGGSSASSSRRAAGGCGRAVTRRRRCPSGPSRPPSPGRLPRLSSGRSPWGPRRSCSCSSARRRCRATAPERTRAQYRTKTSGSVCASWSAIVPMRIPPRIESPSPAQPLYLRGETGCADAGSSSDAVGSPSSLSAPLPADSGRAPAAVA
jgi:integral membrane protein